MHRIMLLGLLRDIKCVEASDQEQNIGTWCDFICAAWPVPAAPALLLAQRKALSPVLCSSLSEDTSPNLHSRALIQNSSAPVLAPFSRLPVLSKASLRVHRDKLFELPAQPIVATTVAGRKPARVSDSSEAKLLVNSKISPLTSVSVQIAVFQRHAHWPNIRLRRDAATKQRKLLSAECLAPKQRDA